MRPELDRYSSDMLDDDDYGVMTAHQRREAERALSRYDKENNRLTRGADLLR